MYIMTEVYKTFCLLFSFLFFCMFRLLSFSFYLKFFEHFGFMNFSFLYKHNQIMTDSKKFPCGICLKTVANNHNALCCDSCDKWVHIKCNFLNKYTYKKLQKDNFPWFCVNCIKDHLNQINKSRLT